MQGDYYAVLGVSPSSEDVVIRAAYRALMRRYHPDADRSSDATDRARLINAAYAVLSDPEQRKRYDGTLAARGLIKFEHQRKAGLRVTPAGVAAVTILTAAAALIALSPPMDGLPDASVLFGSPRRTGPVELASAPKKPAADAAEHGCSTDAAKGLIKAEIFDRAARLGGSDSSALMPIADRSLVRIDLAEAKGGADGGTVSCGGWLALDLPLDVAVEGGRRNLNAEIIYALVPAGSKGVRLTSLAGVNGLAQSLATVSRAPDPEASAAWPGDTPVQRAVPQVEHIVAAPPPARRIVSASATSPSRPRRAAPVPPSIPQSHNLTALDEHLDLFMAQSLARADATKRKDLEVSERRFLKRRDACTSEACKTAAYIRQMRTISQVMAH